MKLTNAYIIDGDVIEKRLKELQKVINNTTTGSWRSECVIEKNLLEWVKQHLKPALPIVEEYIKPTIDYTLRYGSQNSVEWIINELKQDYLTKDF